MLAEMNQSQADVTLSHTVEVKKSGSLRRAEWEGGCKKHRGQRASDPAACVRGDCKQPSLGSENPAGPLQRAVSTVNH